MAALSFRHFYEPGAGGESHRTLLALHAAGGGERDLVALARMVCPVAGILCPRGRISMGNGWRFYRRLGERVDDIDDLQRGAAQLSAFVGEAAERYGFDPQDVVGVGIADGAVTAATMLLASPEALAGAVLFRGGLPAMPDRLPRLAGTPVLVSNGLHDRFAAPGDTRRLAALLRAAGAEVMLAWQQSAHQLVQADVDGAAAWFRACVSRRSSARSS
ncbi:MAG: alpha/beta hydrolase [Vicinamibacterales bacterium]